MRFGSHMDCHLKMISDVGYSDLNEILLLFRESNLSFIFYANIRYTIVSYTH